MRPWLDYRRIVTDRHSPRRGRGIDAIIIHATAGGSMAGAIDTLLHAHPVRSAHFVIGRDGDIVQMVPLDLAAWHAGVSELVVDGECYSDVNSRTVGIELCNRLWVGMGPRTGVRATLRFDNGAERTEWWEPYSELQLLALEQLLDDLKDALGGPRPLRGHEEVAMPFGRRRFDPGPLFPWNRFGSPVNRRTSCRFA